MLKVSGMFVSPAEVEGVLIAHDDVLEAAVVGAADADGLVKPRAFVVAKPGVTADATLARVLEQHLKGQLPAFKCPRWIAFLDELPKTATGKIQRFKLRRRAMCRLADWRSGHRAARWLVTEIEERRAQQQKRSGVEPK